MAGNAAVTIRVGPELKREAAKAAEGSGLDLSTATRLFNTQMVNTNALPITFDYRRPNAESREAIAQVREIVARGGAGRFATADDMIAKLGLSMAVLVPEYTPSFRRDVKLLKRGHIDTPLLAEAMRLVCENTPESREELRRRHNMHYLRGDWAGSEECHVANAGDWLCV